MATHSEALALAVRQLQAGRLQAAEQIYRQILAVDPDHADALHLLGLVASRQDRLDVAVECISRAIALNGTEAAFHSNLGDVFNDQGKLDEAVSCCRRALELKPDYAPAHYHLGNALLSQKRHKEAVRAYHRAMELGLNQPQVHSNLAMAFVEIGRLEEAVGWYRQALQLKPDDVVVHNNLGTAFLAQGKLDDAVDCFRRAIELKPDGVEAHSNLGIALQAQRKVEAAVDCFRRALQLNPNYAEAMCNLGSASRAQGKLDEAVAYFQQALDLKPSLPEAHSNLGNVFRDQGDLNQAIASYRRAIELKPQFLSAYDNLLYSLWFCPDLDAAAIYKEHGRWQGLWAEPLSKEIVPHANDASPERRLRVGYVSPNFFTHAEAYFLAPLLAAHNHQQFEIFCYSDVVWPDQITEKLRSCSDAWRRTTGLSDEGVAQLVRGDQIDILVDLTIHMAQARPLVFARKPAPVQVCWLAYQGTTGLTTMDYRLTDPHLDPPELFDSHYSEESVRLADSFWCYDPLVEGPSVSELPARSNGFVTFGCLNDFCKVNAGVLRLWARVLSAVERSRLLLLAPDGSARENVLQILATAGISADRITFVARQPRIAYLELYDQIDIGLDTLPYNGQTTTLDAAWMGVPVVTVIGKTAVGRAGLSMNHQLGLSDLVADTPGQFVEISVRLASDLPRLSELRASLREKLKASPLMDAPRFARSMEAAFRSMWQRWCAAQIA